MRRTIMKRTLQLVKTAYEIPQLISDGGAEIALAGRSNVGKSTLINRLAGRRTLAKTSATPGKTVSINYYRADPGGYFLVDLPGYGYARRSHAERAKWGELTERFLTQSPGLRAAAVLLDARLPPQKNDLELVAWLRQEGIPIVAVLTKCDKVKRNGQTAKRQEWDDLLGGNTPPLFFSGLTGEGGEALWAALDATAAMPPRRVGI